MNVPLDEPITEEDILDHEDYLDSLYSSQKAFAARLAHQLGESHPLVVEMRYIQQVLDFAAKRLAALRAASCFPTEKSLGR